MLGFWSLTAMTFLSVSGGPIGMETAMLESDIYTVLACTTWIFVTYVIPLSFMSYELAMDNKETPDGGPIGWVYRGLGKKWGIANAIWDFLDTHIDNSIYPVLFADNAISMGAPVEYRTYIAWGLIAFVFIINYGEIEGKTAILISLFIISPFVGLICVTPITNMWTWNQTPTIASIRNTITVLIWNVSGYDMTTPYAHRIKNPESSYFWAYLVNGIGIYLMMIMVFCLGTHYNHNTNTWTDGSFVSMAGQYSYPFRIWMALSALAASTGVLTAELCSTSYLYFGLSKLGFSKRFENSKFNLLINAGILFFSVLLDLSVLIKLSAILNTFTLNCEIIAWLKIKGCSYWRIIFSLWIIINNIFIMTCFSVECVISIVIACGLALLGIVLTETSISNDKN